MSTIVNLQKKLTDFRDERDWRQFHDPINLAVALQLEVSEILECFQWRADAKKFEDWYSDPANKKALTEEVADVFSYLLLLAESLGIDIAQATEEKIAHNAAKYPVEKAKGNSLKYNKLT